MAPGILGVILNAAKGRFTSSVLLHRFLYFEEQTFLWRAFCSVFTRNPCWISLWNGSKGRRLRLEEKHRQHPRCVWIHRGARIVSVNFSSLFVSEWGLFVLSHQQMHSVFCLHLVQYKGMYFFFKNQNLKTEINQPLENLTTLFQRNPLLEDGRMWQKLIILHLAMTERGLTQLYRIWHRPLVLYKLANSRLEMFGCWRD